MSVYLALGSNSGDRISHLEKALCELNKVGQVVRVSPLYETATATPAIIPGAEWIGPFINIVIEFAPPALATPESFLLAIKAIERKLGREALQTWAPRPIDIDILYWRDLEINTSHLQIPHSRIFERAFVLDPLKDLVPLRLAGHRPILHRAHELADHAPGLMATINLTPDSFSDGGRYNQLGEFESYLEKIECKVAYIDLGAESTRPNAIPVDPATEWERLAPFLQFLKKRYANKLIHPKISIDTRHYSTMLRASEHGIDMINDVSGLTDPNIAKLYREEKTDFVLMHSLSVPPNKEKVLPQNISAMVSLKSWFTQRLSELEAIGIPKERIVLDPGIGFGKTPLQCLEILANIKELQTLNARLLVGASRKSFMRALIAANNDFRDSASNGISHFLANQGVDILRLHNPIEFHSERLTLQQMRNLHACTIHQN